MAAKGSTRRISAAKAAETRTGYVSNGAGDPDGRRGAQVVPAWADGASYLTAEVSASAVRHNLNLMRRQVGTDTRLCAVVKADCYGHGLRTLLETIAAGADAVGVTTPVEAFAVRNLGYAGPVLMFFTPCASENGESLQGLLRELIARDITLTLTSTAAAQPLAEAAGAVGKKAKVHIKIDTGMGRSGVPPDEAPDLVSRARCEKTLHLTGLYTHFAAADAKDKTFAEEQFRRFIYAADSCGETKGLTLHTANSAAVLDLPETHLDMVRPGIALYGYQPSDEMRNRLELRPSLRLTGRLMQVKHVPPGSRCGYGLTYTFERPSVVGLVPIGYADGYLRSLSNRATMRVRGRDVPVRGRVSMDQTIVDLTDVSGARVGDEVEIVSPDPKAPHSVENLARLAGTIPYEVTCRLGERVRRVLVE